MLLRLMLAILAYAPFLAFETGGAAGGDGGGNGDGKGGGNSSGGEGTGDGKDGESGGEGGDGDDGEEPEFKPIATKAEFDAMLKDRIRRAENKGRREGATAKETELTTKLEREKAEADGDLQKQIELLKKDIADRDAKIAAAELADLRRKVADKHKLSPVLASRLQGTTEAELEKDAKELAKAFGTIDTAETRDGDTGAGAGANGSNGGKGGNGPNLAQYKIRSHGKMVKIEE